VEIHLNGESRKVPEDFSIRQLIESLNLPPERIAIELNRNVIRRGDWSSTILHDSDRVEVVHFVGGGLV